MSYKPARNQRESRRQANPLGLFFGPQYEGNMFSEMSADLQQTIPEDSILQNKNYLGPTCCIIWESDIYLLYSLLNGTIKHHIIVYMIFKLLHCSYDLTALILIKRMQFKPDVLTDILCIPCCVSAIAIRSCCCNVYIPGCR
jgi:hypothetical protein